MSETTDTQEWYRNELYTLASVADISGRSSMSKEQLLAALKEEAPKLLNPFQDVDNIEEGDAVKMNHLKSVLTVSSVEETDTHISVVLTTPRGGRHKLVKPTGDSEVGKNGSSPHLERWRAGDQEWMNNSTDPVYFLEISSDTDSESDDSEDQE
jgi:hypothetical protein